MKHLLSTLVRIYLVMCITLLLMGCSSTHKVSFQTDATDYSALEKEIASFIETKDARIGIAVIIDGKDTVAVNGNRDFPMVSVYKFPQSLAVADYCLNQNLLIKDSIFISKDHILPDTWSPLREKYGRRDLRLPIEELLSYSLQQSDNNACDILFQLIGGPEMVDSLMKELGYPDIHILNTEKEMHEDVYLCYANRSTPIEMARLFNDFYREQFQNNPFYKQIGEMMLTCGTGLNRLPAPLTTEEIRIGHKTGTGDRNSQGRLIGVNDAGYVFLPNGGGYSIAVFIADSAYDLEETESLIGQLSALVFTQLNKIIGEG